MSRALHPKNPHSGPYPIKDLCKSYPELEEHVVIAKSGLESINFGNPAAVKAINKALLLHYYDIQEWDIPAGYLCPPVPGRAEYIHKIKDLAGTEAHILDVGVGANAIYPIIGTKAYKWSFVGVDTDQRALDNVEKIIERNTHLKDRLELRLQVDSKAIFHNVIRDIDRFDVTICNPPFFKSAEDALKSTQRKNRNLHGQRSSKRNFKGKSNELWTEGGEQVFVTRMIEESQKYRYQVKWFTSLISRQEHLPKLEYLLKSMGVEYRIKEMQLGQKKSRILCWRW